MLELIQMGVKNVKFALAWFIKLSHKNEFYMKPLKVTFTCLIALTN